MTQDDICDHLKGLQQLRTAEQQELGYLAMTALELLRQLAEVLEAQMEEKRLVCCSSYKAPSL